MNNYSVLMSVYKKVLAEDLKLSIDSMLNQTFPPNQVVVVLDGPVNDDVRQLIDTYNYKSPGLFTIVPLDQNHGLAYALNTGLDECRNEYIARMDSDDYSLPERCEKQLLFLKNNSDYAMVGTSTKNFVGDITNIISYEKKRAITYEEICSVINKSCPFCHPSVMFKKSIILRVGGYDAELTRSQDYDLFSRLIWHGYKAANLPDVLFLFRADEGFSARTKSKESCDCRIIIQRRLLERKQCSLADFFYIWLAMKATRLLPPGIYKMLYQFIKKKG